MKKKAYSSVAVNDVPLSKLLAGRAGAAVDVGCDIGKQRVLVMLRWGRATSRNLGGCAIPAR